MFCLDSCADPRASDGYIHQISFNLLDTSKTGKSLWDRASKARLY